MALARYVITAPVTVPAGAPAAVVAGEPGTGRGGLREYGPGLSAQPLMFHEDWLDPLPVNGL